MESNGIGCYQNKNGRWQDYHFLRRGNLATLKGEQMQNKNVQIPYELFFQLLQYFLMDNYDGEEIIRLGLENMISVPMNFLMETAEGRKVGKQKNFSLKYWQMEE